MANKYQNMSKAQLAAELLRRDQASRDPRQLELVIHDLQVHQEEIRVQNEQLLEIQKSLEESRDRYAELYDLAPVAYVTLDRAGVVAEINLTGTSLLGHDRKHIVGTPLLVYVADHDRARLLDHLRRCRAATGEVRTELELRRRDGAAIPVALTSNPPQCAADHAYRIAIVDLTALRQAERERQEMFLREQAANAASQAKDNFLAVLSHELRTPLTPVLAAVSALEQQRVPKGIRPTLSMIRRNVQMEASLIDDLLDVTRINRNKLKLEFAPVDGHATVGEVIEMCREELDDRRMRTELRLGAASATVRADPMRLRQVVWNLLRNAIKFTHARGAITIATDNPEPGQFRLAITDTGVGIAPDMLQRIFNPFEQSRDGERARGLGLGLAICKAMVAAHGGQIDARSDGPGKGATFAFTIPAVASRAAPQPGSAEPHAATMAPAPGLSILLVEDHPDTAHIMSKLLRARGHRVRTAASVSQAIAAAKDPFDLLVSDIGLPDGSGLQVMRAIRQHRPNLPGIALSGYGSEDDLRKSKEAGFNHHLIKPVDFERLAKIIATVSNRK